MIKPDEVSGVLLAAGRSTRMGRDKALLEVGGQSLWRRQRELFAQAGVHEIFLSARLEQPWVRDAKWTALVVDDLPNAGPISGITAALERTTHGHVLVVAVDLPFMTVEWLQTLLQDAEPGVGVVGHREGSFEPLAALYPREMLSLFWSALAAAKYALQPIIAQAEADGLIRRRAISPPAAPWFENWNEPVAPFVAGHPSR
jgi:molybdopterin-guanine dinucleotide biosynthesis protein A